MVALALAAASLALPRCPYDVWLGTVRFARSGAVHEVSLGDCRDRVVAGAARPTTRRTLVSPGGKYVLRWDVPQSSSLAADGVGLEVRPRAGGRWHVLSRRMLGYRDYVSWCDDDVVLFVDGFDRVATHHKRLMVAVAPDWRSAPLWNDRTRAFGSVTCAPNAESVAVLSQPDRNDANFFHTRWELWLVDLASGLRTLMDRPPPGSADESPRWSRDGGALFFVRERQSVGRLMLWRGGPAIGPFAALGYNLGYYGHHDWWATASWSDGAPG